MLRIGDVIDNQVPNLNYLVPTENVTGIQRRIGIANYIFQKLNEVLRHWEILLETKQNCAELLYLI